MRVSGRKAAQENQKWLMEDESSCDDVHEILDQFAEPNMCGEDAATLMPLVDHHLRLCPDCFEETELVRIFPGSTCHWLKSKY